MVTANSLTAKDWYELGDKFNDMIALFSAVFFKACENWGKASERGLQKLNGLMAAL